VKTTLTIISLALTLTHFCSCSSSTDDREVHLPKNLQVELDQKKRGADTFLKKDATVSISKTHSGKQLIANSPGLIVLSDQLGKNDFVRIYNDDGNLWHEFSFFYDDSDGKFDYENENFRPFAFHPDYFILNLKCVGEDKNRYEVVVNEETGLKKFVKKEDRTLRFETWEELIPTLFAVGFKKEENPLRDIPNGKLKVVELPNEVIFHPIKVEKDWLKVSWEDPKKNKGKDENSGWIRWKENQKILIEFFYFA